MTTCGADSNENFANMTVFPFQCVHIAGHKLIQQCSYDVPLSPRDFGKLLFNKMVSFKMADEISRNLVDHASRCAQLGYVIPCLPNHQTKRDDAIARKHFPHHLPFLYSDVTCASRRVKNQQFGGLFSNLFGLTTKETSKPASLAFREGNPPITDSPHNGPVLRKAFPRHDVMVSGNHRSSTDAFFVITPKGCRTHERGAGDLGHHNFHV